MYFNLTPDSLIGVLNHRGDEGVSSDGITGDNGKKSKSYCSEDTIFSRGDSSSSRFPFSTNYQGSTPGRTDLYRLSEPVDIVDPG